MRHKHVGTVLNKNYMLLFMVLKNGLHFFNFEDGTVFHSNYDTFMKGMDIIHLFQEIHTHTTKIMELYDTFIMDDFYQSINK